MALLSPVSQVAINSQLDLFQIPPTDVSQNEGYTVPYFPNSDTKQNEYAGIEVNIPAKQNTYIDLSKTKIYIRGKITAGTTDLKKDPDGDMKDSAKTALVALVNNGLHSLFSNIEIYLNDVLVSSPSTHSYCYEAMLKKMLNNSYTVQKFKDSMAMYYPDTNYETLTDDEGFKSRQMLASGSQEFEMIDSIYQDIFSLDKYLLSGVGIRLRLNRTNKNFFLQKATSDATNNYQFHLLELKVLVRKISIHPSVVNAHEKLLNTNSCKYDLQRNIIRTYNLSQGTTQFNLEDLFQGSIPMRLVLGMVTSSSFNGSITSNPYHFKNNSLSKIEFFVDNVPVTSLNLNFSNNRYLEALDLLYTNLGYSSFGEGEIPISRKTFKDGKCLFIFDTTPSIDSSGHLNLNKKGNTRLNLIFKEALTDETTLVLLASFSNLIEINSARQVSHDFFN